MGDVTEVIETQTAEPADQGSLDERLLKSVESKVLAATESETANTEAEVAQEAKPAGTEEAAKEQTETKAPEKIEVTDDQLADTKFWGSLDAEGWRSMEHHYPVATKYAKAGQAAATRMTNKAREEADAIRKGVQPLEEAAQVTAKPKVSEAMKAALKKANSLDEDEAIEGQLEVAELVAAEREERRTATETAKQKEAREVITSAFKIAETALPAIKTIPNEELDKVYDSDADLQADMAAAESHPDKQQRARLIANVLKECGRRVIAQKDEAARADAAAKAAEKKTKDQERLRSTEQSPITSLVETPSGKGPGGAKTFDKDGLDFINRQLVAAAPR